MLQIIAHEGKKYSVNGIVRNTNQSTDEIGAMRIKYMSPYVLVRGHNLYFVEEIEEIEFTESNKNVALGKYVDKKV